MTVVEAFVSYGIKVILFAIVAGVGIATGIKLRKVKNLKTTDKE